jgi:sialate O-acetylesterase
MIRPMLGFNFRGALWYQGESNVYSKDADLYTCQLKALMQDWRASFGAQTDSDMPFFVIQLAPYTQGISDTDHLPNMRLYQAAASDSAYVALVTAIDTGDLASKQGNIHPMDKKTLGVRAAKGMCIAIIGLSSTKEVLLFLFSFLLTSPLL